MIVRLGAIEFKLFPVRSTYALVAIYLIASALCSLSILPNLHNAHVPVISVVDVLRPLHRQQLDDSRPPQPSQALEEHSYTPDGLLVVNPHGPHPIFELMRKAEEDWNKKLSRASTTLDEAVTEYRRRYKRRPPLGFDKWWDYVVKHGIQLPDEYDEIFYDLEAYWGLDPEDLSRAHDELENGYEVITVAKEPSSSMFEFVQSTVSGNLAEHFRRIRNILDLITEVEHELPPMRITFSPHDNPSMLSDWVIKNMTMEAAKSGTTVKEKDFPPITRTGWIEGCDPTSPARQNPRPDPPLSPPPRVGFSPQHVLNTSAPKTFIASHRTAMDPCMHPELLVMHGQFLSHKGGPYPQRTLVPRFSLCGTLLHHDIRPPVPYAWISEEEIEANGDIVWREKIDERLNWRGSTTGIYANPEKAWAYSHRSRLVSLANAVEGNVSILPVPESESEPVGAAEEVRKVKVNPAWMDIAFIGRPTTCDEAKGTCREMSDAWEFRRRQGPIEEGRYKFILDVDGNGWSGRFQRLISSNALIFKSTIYPEWYTSRIAPWLHYVPIQVSYADLYDALAFFREHDDLAEHIATQGKEWSRRFWRKEDMAAYLYRLLLEYARVTSSDREAMSYGWERDIWDDDL